MSASVSASSSLPKGECAQPVITAERAMKTSDIHPCKKDKLASGNPKKPWYLFGSALPCFRLPIKTTAQDSHSALKASDVFKPSELPADTLAAVSVSRLRPCGPYRPRPDRHIPLCLSPARDKPEDCSRHAHCHPGRKLCQHPRRAFPGAG